MKKENNNISQEPKRYDKYKSLLNLEGCKTNYIQEFQNRFDKLDKAKLIENDTHRKLYENYRIILNKRLSDYKVYNKQGLMNKQLFPVKKDIIELIYIIHKYQEIYRSFNIYNQIKHLDKKIKIKKIQLDQHSCLYEEVIQEEMPDISYKKSKNKSKPLAERSTIKPYKSIFKEIDNIDNRFTQIFIEYNSYEILLEKEDSFKGREKEAPKEKQEENSKDANIRDSKLSPGEFAENYSKFMDKDGEIKRIEKKIIQITIAVVMKEYGDGSTFTNGDVFKKICEKAKKDSSISTTQVENLRSFSDIFSKHKETEIKDELFKVNGKTWNLKEPYQKKI